MTKRRKPYGREFREEVLQLVESSGKSVAAIEEDLGLTPGLIYKWRERYGAPKEDDGSLRPGTLTEAKAEIRRLQRELAVVRQERDILKKAVAIFSRDQP